MAASATTHLTTTRLTAVLAGIGLLLSSVIALALPAHADDDPGPATETATQGKAAVKDKDEPATGPEDPQPPAPKPEPPEPPKPKPPADTGNSTDDDGGTGNGNGSGNDSGTGTGNDTGSQGQGSRSQGQDSGEPGDDGSNGNGDEGQDTTPGTTPPTPDPGSTSPADATYPDSGTADNKDGKDGTGDDDQATQVPPPTPVTTPTCEAQESTYLLPDHPDGITTYTDPDGTTLDPGTTITVPAETQTTITLTWEEDLEPGPATWTLPGGDPATNCDTEQATTLTDTNPAPSPAPAPAPAGPVVMASNATVTRCELDPYGNAVVAGNNPDGELLRWAMYITGPGFISSSGAESTSLTFSRGWSMNWPFLEPGDYEIRCTLADVASGELIDSASGTFHNPASRPTIDLHLTGPICPTSTEPLELHASVSPVSNLSVASLRVFGATQLLDVDLLTSSTPGQYTYPIPTTPTRSYQAVITTEASDGSLGQMMNSIYFYTDCTGPDPAAQLTAVVPTAPTWIDPVYAGDKAVVEIPSDPYVQYGIDSSTTGLLSDVSGRFEFEPRGDVFVFAMARPGPFYLAPGPSSWCRYYDPSTVLPPRPPGPPGPPAPGQPPGATQQVPITGIVTATAPRPAIRDTSSAIPVTDTVVDTAATLPRTGAADSLTTLATMAGALMLAGTLLLVTAARRRTNE